jgi:hypothetical protein
MIRSAVFEAEVDARAIGREGDLKRRRLRRGRCLGRVLTQATQRRREVGGDGRSQYALGRRDRLDAPAKPLEGVEQDRRRRLAPDETRRRTIVGTPDPNRDRGPPIEADR